MLGYRLIHVGLSAVDAVLTQVLLCLRLFVVFRFEAKKRWETKSNMGYM